MVPESQPHQEKQDFDYCLTLRHKILSTEYLKLAGAQNTPPDINILADVLPSQPKQMDIPLQKLNFVMDGGAQNKQKKSTHDKYKWKTQMKPVWIQFRKWNTRIPKSLKEIPSAKLFPFFIEKNNLQQSKPFCGTKFIVWHLRDQTFFLHLPYIRLNSCTTPIIKWPCARFWHGRMSNKYQLH